MNFSSLNKYILLTSNAYLPNRGGVENSLYYLARAFSEKGYNVIILISDVGWSPAYVDEIIENVEVRRYRTRFINSKIALPFNGIIVLMNLLSQFIEIRKRYSPVLTVSRYHLTTLLATMAGLKPQCYLIPGVVKYQDSVKNLQSNPGLSRSMILRLKKRYHMWVQKLALSFVDRCLVFSETMFKQVATVASPKDTVSIVKPGVDCDFFKPLSEQAKKALKKDSSIFENDFVFLSVGRMVRAKGFDLLVDAMRSLSQCKLVLVGDGPELEELKRRANELGMSNQIEFIGQSSNPLKYYQIADAFVMSSRYEPLGQTILEALACDLPVVAFRSGPGVDTATEEVIGKYAFYADDANAESLAEAMQRCMECKFNNGLAYQPRQLALTSFSWKTLAGKLLNE
ncbi:hypothetical protein GCM10009092_17380 [Bowmanella denitrificans]|uniref:Uncharacterized protein n=1 Tax=Bowmanella denitrificans TaxID=366582 RepID=A0ABN0X2X6_9ALTE